MIDYLFYFINLCIKFMLAIILSTCCYLFIFVCFMCYFLIFIFIFYYTLIYDLLFQSILISLCSTSPSIITSYSYLQPIYIINNNSFNYYNASNSTSLIIFLSLFVSTNFTIVHHTTFIAISSYLYMRAMV